MSSDLRWIQRNGEMVLQFKNTEVISVDKNGCPVAWEYVWRDVPFEPNEFNYRSSI